MKLIFHCLLVELCLKICSMLKLTGIPCMFPESEFSIVLISACASTHNKQVSVFWWAVVKPCKGVLDLKYVVYYFLLQGRICEHLNFGILYLVQLIEHPMLRIPNDLMFTFRVFFPDKSVKLMSKYTQKCQYNLLY